MASTVANRFLTALGPVKMEILNLTTVTTADTVTTNMQNPRFALGVDNTGALSVNTSITISGKTLTITNSSYAGAGICNVLVFGF
jgi:hypothetical protein